MAIRTDHPATLPHAEAERAAELLSDYTNDLVAHANRTRNAAVRRHCTDRANEARQIAETITRQLWRWTP